MNSDPKRLPAPVAKDPIALARKLVPDGDLIDEDRRVLDELRAQGEHAIEALLECALQPRSGGLTGHALH